MDSNRTIRVGTRGSALAVTQTGWVVDRMRGLGLTVEVETITTRGDSGHEGPIFRPGQAGGDGVFVRELEQALPDGRIDAAVHSLKDLPTAETPGLDLACVPERALPFDVLVGRTAATLAGLPAGAVVGTSSIRRVVQVKSLRSDLVVRPVRGNVDTRLRRLDEGDYDALILAGAGLERLGRGGRISEVLRPDAFWPAVAQGALVVQIRSDDAPLRNRISTLDHPPSHAAVRAERACLAALAGGCLAPIGGWARTDASGALTLGGCVMEFVPDDAGGMIHRLIAEHTAGDHAAGVSKPETPESLGERVAAALLKQGAAEMLARVRSRDASPA